MVTGEDIQFDGAMIDASGDAGGGKVMVGGDWGGGNPASRPRQQPKRHAREPTRSPTRRRSASTRDHDHRRLGQDRGDGGKVILWSDSQTTFAGTILARGGDAAGNGGFVEVSSKGELAFTGMVDTRAPNGLNGTLLLDPEDYRDRDRRHHDGRDARRPAGQRQRCGRDQRRHGQWRHHGHGRRELERQQFA